jgi:hypothetical protein
MTITSTELQAGLDRFYGSETWFSHPLNRFFHYTEGVQYFATEAGAYWLLDIIATEVFPFLKKEPFLHITAYSRDGKGSILVDDGNGMHVHYKSIDYTDLPEGSWHFYLTDNVLLLPSEY